MTATAPNPDPDIGGWSDDRLLAELALTREACEREPDPFAQRTYELRARKLELQRKLAIRNSRETERLDAVEIALSAVDAAIARIAALEAALSCAVEMVEYDAKNQDSGTDPKFIEELRAVLNAEKR